MTPDSEVPLSFRIPGYVTGAKVPAYNVQAAVDSEHALIVAQQVTTEATDNRSLLPMAEAAQAAVSAPGQVLHVVADAGYSNGEQAEACESKGILPHVPANRGVNNHGDEKLFDRRAFVYHRTRNIALPFESQLHDFVLIRHQCHCGPPRHETHRRSPWTLASGALLRRDRVEGGPALFDFLAAAVRTEYLPLFVVDQG